MSQIKNSKEIKPRVTEAELLESIEKMNPKEQEALLKNLQKELLAETATEAAPLLEFVLKHIKKIILFIVLCVALISVWGVWQWQQDRAYSASQAEFQKLISQQRSAEKLKALEAFAQNAPKEFTVSLLLEKASIALELKDFELASQSLREVIAQEKQGSALSLSLTFALSDLLLSANKAEQALLVMEEFLAQAPEKLKNTVIEEIALIAEIAGKKERAIEAYTLLLESNEQAVEGAKSYYQERVKQLKK